MPIESLLAIPLSLLIILGAAKLMPEIFERLRMPGIAGEIPAQERTAAFAIRVKPIAANQRCYSEWRCEGHAGCCWRPFS